ncbi:MAG TPA: MaoC family dehydratase [Protaetiibacter sp.]|nr:MaoC family dehydratase [Protaetiibacter sp.]
MRRLKLDALLAQNELFVGTSEWTRLDQQRISEFAHATGDSQWLHLDARRAADGPYGTTIAHGLLVLALLPALTAEVLTVAGAAARINYGLDRVRFPRAVPSGARVRDHVTVLGAEERADGRDVLARLHHRLELEGADEPACVAVTLTLFTREAA